MSADDSLIEIEKKKTKEIRMRSITKERTGERENIV